ASAKGKQPLRATTPVEPTDLQRTEAAHLKIALKQSRQETHISQQSGSGTGEGTEEEPAKDDEENKETGKGGEEVRKSRVKVKKKKQVKRTREVLTRFLEHLKIVRMK
nr:hypothetical protein [Tanacetum cinerariifolium]